MNGLLDHRKLEANGIALQPETAAVVHPQPQQVVLQHQTVDEVDYAIVNKVKPVVMSPPAAIITTDLLKPRYDIAQSQIQEEIREVEMLNAVVQQTLNNTNNQNNSKQRIKKKSVSFCDQVILVATADDEEDCDFVPNPILERVLKGASGTGENDIDTTDSGPGTMKVEQKIVPLNQAQQKEITVSSQYLSAQQLQADIQQRAATMNKMAQQQNLVSELQKQNQPVLYQQYYAMNAPIQHQHQLQPQPVKSVYQQPQQPMRMQYHPDDAKMMQHLQINRSNVATVMPNQHLQIKTDAPPMMQQPLQQQQPQQYHEENKQFAAAPSPYMIVPQHPNLQAARSDCTMYNNNGALLASRLNAQQKLENFINTRTNGQLQMNPNGQMYQKMSQQPAENGHDGHTGLPYNYQFSQQQQHIASAYQRLPITMASAATLQQQQQNQFENGQYQQPMIPPMNSVYMSPPMRTGITPQPQQPLVTNATQKKVSFEPGTKGGDLESPTVVQQLPALGIPTMVLGNPMNQSGVQTRVTIPNNYNNSAIVKASAKALQCNLCRKKHVLAPSMYCADCEFYMSKFTPRR
jgi:hypothetical protein